jgi:hypothetical protein
VFIDHHIELAYDANHEHHHHELLQRPVHFDHLVRGSLSITGVVLETHIFMKIK